MTNKKKWLFKSKQTNRLNAIFRADASVDIGTGHIMRCLTLADELMRRNFNTIFVSKNFPGNIFEIIRQRGHDLIELPALKDSRTDFNDIAAFDAQWETDAKNTLEALRSSTDRTDWLVIDNYSIDKRWELMFKNLADRVLVIDDIADKPHECDILVNENLLSENGKAYDALVPKYTKRLFGPKYALLRPEFMKIRKKNKLKNKVKRIFIFYGGADNTNETSKALKAFAGLNKPNIHLDIVVGSANSHKENIQSELIKLPCSKTLHFQLPYLADLMSEADLALSAGGSTIWELLYIGVPVIATTTAENQIPNIQRLSENGIVKWLGSANEVSADLIEDELRRTILKPGSFHRYFRAGWQLVDGKGRQRIASEMLSMTGN